MRIDVSSHGVSRLRPLTASLGALGLVALLTLGGCARQETADADISVSSDTAAVTSDTTSKFDTGSNFQTSGDPKIDAFCGGLIELDGNPLLKSADLAMHLRILVMLRVFEDVTPNAPTAVAAATTKVRDFLREAAKIETQGRREAGSEMLTLAGTMDVAPSYNSFLTWVRDNCHVVLDIDPTTIN